MFDNEWPGAPHPAFGWAGGSRPAQHEGWRPWARRSRGVPWGMRLGGNVRRMGRQFPFGPGFGPGRPGPGGRMFGRGDLKYALLDLLRERPKHGYEMIKELEDRSGGFYTPSAGAVYPTLQLLEDRGWVTVETRDGKKVYQLTDAGKTSLAEHHEPGEAFAGPRFWREHEHGPRGPQGPVPHGPHGPEETEGPEGGPWGGPWGGAFGFWRDVRPELRALRHESMEIARLMKAAVMASGGDPERLARLRAIVKRTRADLDDYLGQGQGSAGTRPTPPPGGGPIENL